MAFASDVYTGNGSTTTFALTFPYVRPEHVVVFVNFVSVAYTYTNSTTVNVSPAPGNGLRVEVRRVTPLANPLVDFTDGSVLVAADLDTNALQNLYIEQELDDRQKASVFNDDATGLITAGGRRITAVANPTSAQDAATKNYVDTADALKVAKAGDSMSGALAMGANKVTGLGTPTVSTDAASKGYVDGLIAAATIADVNYGDITVSGGATVWTIDTGAVTSTKILDGTIVNADINASAAIAGTKVAPNFGAQNIITTGNVILNSQGDVRFADSDSSHYVGFQAPATVATSLTWTLPNADAAISGYALVSDASGTLSWAAAGGGATGGSTDKVFFENDQTVTTSYTLTANKNAMSAGPVTINASVTVTVPSGASWVVV